MRWEQDSISVCRRCLQRAWGGLQAKPQHSYRTVTWISNRRWFSSYCNKLLLVKIKQTLNSRSKAANRLAYVLVLKTELAIILFNNHTLWNTFLLTLASNSNLESWNSVWTNQGVKYYFTDFVAQYFTLGANVQSVFSEHLLHLCLLQCQVPSLIRVHVQSLTK